MANTEDVLGDNSLYLFQEIDFLVFLNCLSTNTFALIYSNNYDFDWFIFSKSFTNKNFGDMIVFISLSLVKFVFGHAN